MQKRETGIDILKIIAMFMVVYYHCCYYNMDYGYTPGATEYIPNAARILMNLCSMGVPLFFMCSGYCTLASAGSDWKKMGRKVITILILTLIWNYLTPFPIWFMISLSALYLATPVLRQVKQRLPRLYWCGIGCLFLVTFGLNEAYTFSRLFSPNILDQYAIQGLFTSYALVYYALGDWFRSKDLPVKAAVASLAAGFALSLVDGVLLTLTYGKVFDGVNGAFPMLSTLLMTVGTFSLVRHVRTEPQSKVAPVLAVISNGCLPVYIFHLFFLGHTYRLFVRVLQIEEMQYNILTALAWSLLIWVLSWTAGMAIRRIPYVCYLMKL